MSAQLGISLVRLMVCVLYQHRADTAVSVISNAGPGKKSEMFAGAQLDTIWHVSRAAPSSARNSAIMSHPVELIAAYVLAAPGGRGPVL